MRLVRLLEARGRNAMLACRDAGVSIEEITHPDARIPYQLVDALVERVVQELGACGFALALSQVFDEDTYDAAALVLISSPTFGEGLSRAFAYQRLWADGERFTFRRDAVGGVVRFRHPGPSPIASAVLAELAFVETMNAARMLVDVGARAAHVRFAHERLGDDAELTAALGLAPTYGAKHDELVLDEALVSGAIHAPEGAIAAMHEMLARRALRSVPENASIISRVSALLRDLPEATGVTLEDVAARLRLPSRTLQRRLKLEATSWSDLLDRARRERVRAFELRGVPDKEIAFLVGFADPSALARARARWRRG